MKRRINNNPNAGKFKFMKNTRQNL